MEMTLPIFDRLENLFIGDSHISLLTTRSSPFLLRVQNVLGKKYCNSFHGFRGKNTNGIRTILSPILKPKRRIQAVVIIVGTNSACHDERWESNEEIRNNIRAIINRIKEEDPDIFILLNTPPPLRVDIEYKAYEVEKGRSEQKILREQVRIAEIADLIREFKGPKVGICDLFKAFSEKDGNWYVDDAHLSEDAEDIWATMVLCELRNVGIMGS
ncbi:uncharacterized protein PV09_09848 [Verruconis gallopava]|uniref:SGNH hydrolase-type esterase domain-containing protein n=1 Tax=Verruconis gallopava TaxID=253628 RepID=A0A0D1YC83_9PEZI|nr:uncharacterized protein PV09_09848 [Verruconis gallopava]KIV98306.1 hypothetical protein PV09_09848 [Verruconis gallopava]